MTTDVVAQRVAEIRTRLRALNTEQCACSDRLAELEDERVRLLVELEPLNWRAFREEAL